MSKAAGEDAAAIAAALRIGSQSHQAGRLAEAEQAYQQVLRADPGNPDALHLLGVIAWQVGKHELAASLIGQALVTRPGDAAMLGNHGMVLAVLQRYEQALASYDRALALQPGHAEVLNNRGVALQALGRYSESIASYDRALAAKPDYVEALFNRGSASFAQGNLPEAMTAAVASLGRNASPQARRLFCECLSRHVFGSGDAEERRLVRVYARRALAEAWTRPGDLAHACQSLIYRDPASGKALREAAQSWPQASRDPFHMLGVLASDDLLAALLRFAPIASLEFERALTCIRHSLLDAALSPVVPDDVLAFCCALAQQCFVNEYVLAVQAAELERAVAMRRHLAALLDADAPVPAQMLAVVAAYFPLYGLANAGRLLQREWPASIRDLIRQQVEEPAEEARLRTTIPQLTPITEGVSSAVRDQYEKNPYPRWVETPADMPSGSIEAFLRQQFPLAPLATRADTAALDVLVAGCGSGEHPIHTARRFPFARVLALDLSRASLGYAMRKTRELGLGNIDYGQADILRLDTLGRTFDVIESVGVLHHMEDPMQGWRKLLSLLKPGGFMLIGLYSELARQHVAAARAFIAKGGYAPDAEGIRRCRQDLIAAGADSPAGEVLREIGFFGMSECRDLLFHVQEHRHTLPEIGAFIEENGLSLIGFVADPGILRAYQGTFPQDRTMTALELWHRFEQAHPSAFRGMYQFWVQRTA